MMDEKKTGTFKTLDGEKYTITGFTRIMMMRVEEAVRTNWELNEGRPLPKRPTYTVEGDDAFGGEKIVYYHTEDTLETDEEKKAWKVYKESQSELEARVWKQMIYEAFDCVQVPMDKLKEYVALQKRDRGLELPDPEKYTSRVKRIYVEHIVLCDNTDEMMRLLSETMKAAGVISDKEASVALESFRNISAAESSESAERQDSTQSDSNS